MASKSGWETAKFACTLEKRDTTFVRTIGAV